MSWFAKRPLAQSRAAVLCSLLPWPEDEQEQERVKAVIRESLNSCQDGAWTPGRVEPHAYGIRDCARYDKNDGYDAARTDVLALLAEAYPDGAEVLDPFSGRGLIPLEAVRFGVKSNAIDYSAVATLASRLLIDWPFRDWDGEPDLPFDDYDSVTGPLRSGSRLAYDIETVQRVVGERWSASLDPYFPRSPNGNYPWGYLWAALIPCNECGREFPLYAFNELRLPNAKKKDAGESFEIEVSGDHWAIRVVSGMSSQPPTMRAVPGKSGKLAWCPFLDCGHAHELKEHKRLVKANFGKDAMLVVADSSQDGKTFRPPTDEDRAAAAAAASALQTAPEVGGLPARPNERLFPGSSRMLANLYGAVTFGDLCVDRQNLAYAELARTIGELGRDLLDAGVSVAYAQALTGYCGAVLARKLKRSTRGARLQTKGGSQVGDIFVNESTIGFNYDYFEAGLGDGPGTWSSVGGVPTAVARLAGGAGRSASVQRGSALSLPFRDGVLDAVVTDPPYDAMINYTDASDLYYVWLRRALGELHPEFFMTSNPLGTQENTEEIIASHYWNHNTPTKDHRTPAWYDEKIAAAFAEHRRVVHDDGVVTIVFGHGEPDVWKRLLDAVSKAGLVLTGAWPANTEKGGQAGSANIKTTLTLACRPAPSHRPDGQVAQVDAEVRRLVGERVTNVWTPSNLSYTDQKMAAVGPALEVVGRYARVLDKKGQEVDLTRYLPLARQAVTDAWDFRFDGNPLQVFDRRTQFALEWVRSSGRNVQAVSEARWQRLAADVEEQEVDGLLVDTKSPNGVRLSYATEWSGVIGPEAAFVDVALAAAKAWHQGSLSAAAAEIRASGWDADEPRLWAVIGGLSKALPETDRDGAVWTEMIRNRSGMVAAVRSAEAAQREDERLTAEKRKIAVDNPSLFEDPNSLFGQEGD